MTELAVEDLLGSVGGRLVESRLILVDKDEERVLLPLPLLCSLLSSLLLVAITEDLACIVVVLLVLLILLPFVSASCFRPRSD